MNSFTYCWVFLCCLGFSGWAHSSDEVSVIFERHFDFRSHQMAVVFEKQDVVRFVSNSNFLMMSKNKAILGKLKAEVTSPELSSLKGIIQKLADGKLTKSKSGVTKSPHDLKILFNGQEIELSDREQSHLIQGFILAIEKTDWRGEDALRIDRDSFGKTQVAYEGDKARPVPRAICEAAETDRKQTRCVFRSFGYAYFP